MCAPLGPVRSFHPIHHITTHLNSFSIGPDIAMDPVFALIADQHAGVFQGAVVHARDFTFN